ILKLRPVAFELLNQVFTINELQTVYEVINRASYDRRNFMRTAIESKAIIEVEGQRVRTGGRMAKLFTRTTTTFISHASASASIISSSRSFLHAFGVLAPKKAQEQQTALKKEELLNEEAKEQSKDSTKGLFDF
ncbi:MAG: hypothetical protein K2H75_04555, partial [Muribaculaceae bacterium]|nr:hypothetical protein [Muribaculaceae bacterium]